MLFRKKIQRSCAYCAHGTALEGDEYLCAKKGTVTDRPKCRKFAYDPCKRNPLKPKAPDFGHYSQEDFSL